MIEFVFMLTHDDVTVADAANVLAGLRDSGSHAVVFERPGGIESLMLECNRVQPAVLRRPRSASRAVSRAHDC